MESRERVTVIIPNYNGEKYIEPCLNSLMGQSFDDYSVLVIDNGSSDSSPLVIEKNFPEVRLLRFKKNRGFAAAVNEGIRRAEGKYVILLNNDTVVNKNFIEKLYKAIDNSKSVFACQARMVSLYDRDKMDSAGDLYSALGWAFSIGKDKNAKDFDKDRDIFSACAGAAIYRRDLLLGLGLFDESFFCYLEDMDISFRARRCGYLCRYVHDALVYHAGSASSGSRHNAFKVRLSARNNISLIARNLKGWMLLINLPFLVAGHVIKMIYFMMKGLSGPYLEGLLEGFYRVSRNKKDQRYITVGKKRADDPDILEIKVLKGTKGFVNSLFIEAELLINMFRRF